MLAEKPHGWIPRAVGAVELPAPVRDELQCHPHRPAQCSCQMSNRAVGGDHEIETFHRGSSIEKCIGAGIEVATEGFNLDMGRKTIQLFDALIFLQADQADAGDGRQLDEGGQRKGSSCVSGRIDIALPGDAHFEALSSNPLSPMMNSFELSV